tara:strand:+ start:111 stop:581 length:471 start_codon:yes stop_codon:yes gene_type:complete
MNICETIDNFDINKIFYLDPIKNTVIDNSNFIRILYSNDLLTLNGVYILLDFKNTNIINYNNRIKYCIDVNINSEIINFIKNLEKNILDNSIIKDKNQLNKLGDLLGNGYIKNINLPFYDTKLTNYNNNKFILKISGIWESEIEYGLTYKILDVLN